METVRALLSSKVDRAPLKPYKAHMLCFDSLLLAPLRRPHKFSSVSLAHLALTTVLLLASSVATAQVQEPFKNTSLPIEARVADLLSRMTLEEKVSQLRNDSPGISRLDIPAYDWWNEGLHGIARSGVATVFPQAIGMAATWDSSLLHDIADTISTEARAKNSDAIRHNNRSIYYGLTVWSPNINIFRDPRWGRGQETYGEDPFLTGQLGTAFVKGLQGTDPHFLKVIATPKHFAVHSGPEQDRHGFNVDVSAHDLEDTYLPAFKATITNGHAASVMCAYNAIDGSPACASKMLLQDKLRARWHFTGFVTSDCGAIQDFYKPKGHHFSTDAATATAASIIAGTDISCGGEFAQGAVEAVRKNLLPASAIDTALGRLLTARFRLGMFDPPASVPYAQIPFSEVDSPSHRALALRTARESIVLLKNQHNFLPLSPDVKSIAIIGPNSDSLSALEGNYNGTPADPALPVSALRAAFPHAKLLVAQGAAYAKGLLVQVPASVFHTDPQGNQPGLKGEYFANTDFTGQAAFTRIDPSINFDWRGASPGAGLESTQFSVRWTGTFTPPVAGDIPFNMGLATCYPCLDYESYTVFVDGHQVATTSTSETKNHRFDDHTTFNVHFDDTRPHTLRVDYAHRAKLFGAGLIMNWLPPAEALRDEAVKAAQQADIVVAFVGLTADLEGEEMTVSVDGFAGGDRTSIALPATQSALLDALYATGKPVVIVLLNGSALAIPSAEEHAAAILEAWYPGEAGGTAIADTLTGANNPSGRLPVTFYRSEDQLPPFKDYSMSNRTYRYFHDAPLYTFGFGLSYSSFAYSHLKLSSATIVSGQPVSVEADVTNTSARPGDEVVELYVQPPAMATSPLFTLQGFQRLSLLSGETRHVRFNLLPDQLSTVDSEGNRRVTPGNYHVFVGGSLPSTKSSAASLNIR